MLDRALDGSTHTDDLRRLSRRELEALSMAAQGMTNSEIASRLGVSVHAIKFRLASVYRKLKVTNRTEAAVTFLEYEQSAGQSRGVN